TEKRHLFRREEGGPARHGAFRSCNDGSSSAARALPRTGILGHRQICRYKGGSLACVRPPGEVSWQSKGEEIKSPLPKIRSLARAACWPSTGPQPPRGRPPAGGDCAPPPLHGTRRAALLGPCARAAPLGAIRPRVTTGTGSSCMRQRRTTAC